MVKMHASQLICKCMYAIVMKESCCVVCGVVVAVVVIESNPSFDQHAIFTSKFIPEMMSVPCIMGFSAWWRRHTVTKIIFLLPSSNMTTRSA